MPVVSATPDPQALTVTLVTDLPRPPSEVWPVWADARRLERWWGPPSWPATVTAHDLRPGGRTDYVMTGPDGDRARGLWRVLAADAPRSLSVEDSFADAEGAPDTTLPTTRMDAVLEAVPTGTRMTVVSTFTSAEQMEQVLAMGALEGMTEAMGQIDAVLAD